jgi:hypothetical protein
MIHMAPADEGRRGHDTKTADGSLGGPDNQVQCLMKASHAQNVVGTSFLQAAQSFPWTIDGQPNLGAVGDAQAVPGEKVT